jgi:glycosyltransferase involved in cell wall biosynthesis
MLTAFMTQLYWDERRYPYSLISRIPVVGRVASEKGKRRSLAGIRPDLVRDIGPITDLVLYALKGAGLRRLRESMMFRANRAFSRRVAKTAAGSADVLIAFDTSARDAFTALQGSPTLRVLDLSHPHVQGFRILEEEAKRDPEWAPSSDAPLDPAEIERCRQEELLADHLLAASSFSRECAIADGVPEERISVVPYGVDLDRFKPAIAERDRRGPLRLLFVGQVGQRKGIRYLLDAVRRFSAQHVTLDVVGALLGPKHLYTSVPANVTLHGRVGEDALTEWYQRADVLILPSLVEGFGLVLLEAMASGLPIIASEHTAARDLVEHGKQGFVVPVRSPDAIARAIDELLSSARRLDEMKAAARARAEQYPWGRYTQGICATIRALAQARE